MLVSVVFLSDRIKFGKNIEQISTFDVVLDVLFSFSLWNDGVFRMKPSVKNAADLGSLPLLHSL